MSNAGREFERLVEVMHTLRSPAGCPWDREQTLQSLARYVLEEAYEVVEAIERGDMAGLEEEIGDHIFEGVFLAQVASEMGLFDIAGALHAVSAKLVHRHPHVFKEDGQVHDAASKERAPSADKALERWDTQKAQERARAGHAHRTLGNVPRALPSLLRAFTIAKRAATVGFDWHHAGDVITKIEEEVAELRETLTSTPDDAAHAEEEMGDLLFAIANLSRKLAIEPEAALRRANEKFIRRFDALEQRVLARGATLDQLTLEQMEVEWQEVKREHIDESRKG